MKDTPNNDSIKAAQDAQENSQEYSRFSFYIY